jgi:hypothetical protein
MKSTTLLSAAATAAVVLADPPDNTQPYGTNPVNISSVDFLGDQLTNSCTHRDLGFVGQVAGDWYAVFGDNLWCDTGVTDPDQDPSGFHGMVRDAVALTTDDPLMVQYTQLNSDTPVAHPNQVFIPSFSHCVRIRRISTDRRSSSRSTPTGARPPRPGSAAPACARSTTRTACCSTWSTKTTPGWSAQVSPKCRCKTAARQWFSDSAILGIGGR